MSQVYTSQLYSLQSPGLGPEISLLLSGIFKRVFGAGRGRVLVMSSGGSCLHAGDPVEEADQWAGNAESTGPARRAGGCVKLDKGGQARRGRALKVVSDKKLGCDVLALGEPVEGFLEGSDMVKSAGGSE